MGRDHPARSVAAQSPCAEPPLALKIRAARGGPLSVGDNEGQDQASISRPEPRSGSAVLPPGSPFVPVSGK